MEIQQFIYTKVPPERSPWKKTGFHMVLYPTDFLAKKDVLEIESKLHYPGQGIFEQKRVVFYQVTQSGPVLGVIFLKTLASKDEFGREGVFVAHGFLLPEPAAHQVRNPTALADLLADRVVSDTEAVLAHPDANFETGAIRPTHLPDAQLQALTGGALPELTDTERRLVPALYGLATQGTNQDAVVVQGLPAEVAEVFGRCLAWFPPQLRTKLSFDAGFDGGKLFFFPLKLVGYSKEAPTTGDPLRFSLSGARFEPNERLQHFTEATSFFSRWVQKETGGFPSENLLAVYQLAGFLEGHTRELPDPLVVPEGFVKANFEAIRTTFMARASEQLDKAWAELYAQEEAPPELLKLVLDNLAAGAFAKRMTALILRQAITPKQQKTPLPDAFVRAGGAPLATLMKLWQKKKLVAEDLAGLTESQEADVFAYLARSDYRTEPWALDLLRKSPARLQALAAQLEARPAVLAWVAQQVEGGYGKLAPLLAEELIQQEALAELATPAAWPTHLENALARQGWEDKLSGALVQVAKSLNPTADTHPVLAAVASPPADLPPVIAEKPVVRQAYLRLLLAHHNPVPEALDRLGYAAEEVLAAKNAGGLLGKVRQWLGF